MPQLICSQIGFKQSMFLPVDNEGVCYSFTVHWARRILVGNKPNWGISKKLPEAHPITPDRDQKERIISKVANKISKLSSTSGCGPTDTRLTVEGSMA